MRRYLTVIPALVVALTGCGDEDSDIETFRQMVDDGATCQELLAMRGEFEPTDRGLLEVNDTLEQIGCEDGERDDLPSR